MSPQFIRAVFSILAIRAIFISPVQASEFGPRSHPGHSCLKRMEEIRPSRLRFTNPCPASAAIERLDCIDGGDDGDDDERPRPAPASLEAWPLDASLRSTVPVRNLVGAMAPGFVRLRC
jgi:hypothetical protein